MGTLTIAKSADNVMHGSHPAGDFSPVWAQLIDDFSAGHFILNPGHADPDKQPLMRPHHLHSQCTVTLDPVDVVHSADANSLNVAHAAFTSPLAGDVNMGRLWVNTNERMINQIEYYQHQYTKRARDDNDEGTSDGWIFNYYDRMRFWVKVSPSVEFPPLASSQQLDIGTYTRAGWGDDGDQEDGGWHYYHKFCFGYTGEWHQVIVDMAPQAVRSKKYYGPPGIGSGTFNSPAENGNWSGLNWESLTQNVNYFDRLTSFYIDYGRRENDDTNQPHYMKIGQMEFYKEPYDEASPEVIASLNGVYVPGSNRLYVAWKGNLIESPMDTTDHQVVYSFSNIHVNGWGSGTSIGYSNGSTADITNGGYRDMRIDRTDITMGANDIIYVAIRKKGTTPFRQIAIPLTQAGRDAVVLEKRNHV